MQSFRICFNVIVLFIVACLAQLRAQLPPGVALGNPGAWLQPAERLPEPSTSQHASGLDYLLIDQQSKLGTAEHFHRIAVRILSEAGLSQVGEVHVSFDPTAQTVTFHHALVRRNNQELNRLDSSKISLMRREASADSGVYNGRQTVMLILGDLRVGDVVDYAYSIQGQSPVFEGHPMDSWYMQYASPIERLRLRLLVPKAMPLRWLGVGPKVETPQLSEGVAENTWLWDRHSLAGIDYEAGAPIWYAQYPLVQISDFADWHAVIQWGCRLYPLDQPLPADVENRLAEFARLSPEKGAIAALEWVQTEIRYLSLSLGESSHRPHAPAEVCANRFGDCKDKALLLSTLLRRLGMDAVPAFVSSMQGQILTERLPDPSLFDHCIVHLVLKGQSYWLDPTRQYQAGQLADRSTTIYKWALPLRASGTGLVKIQPTERTERRLSSDETYLSQGPTKPVRLQVLRRFEGVSADRLRGSLAMSSPDQLEKNFLNGYSHMYPSCVLTRPLSYRDLKESNTIECSAELLISDFWKDNGELHNFRGEVMPLWLDDVLRAPDQAHRSTPFDLGEPLEISQAIHLKLDRDIPVESKSYSEKTEGFELSEEVQFSKHTLDLNYHFHSLNEQVSASKMESYIAGMKRIRERLGYYVTLGAQARGFYLNWLGAFALLLVVLVACYLCYRISSSQSAPGIPPPCVPSHLKGLGGWLLLVGFGVVLRPLVLIKVLYATATPVLDLARWQLLTNPDSPSFRSAYAPVLLCEMAMVALMLVCSVTALILYFRRHYQFPRLMIGLLVGTAVYQVLDFWGASVLLPQQSVSDTNLRVVIQQMMAALVWTPYFLYSKRVKATFVEGARYVEVPPVPPKVQELSVPPELPKLE